MANLRQITLNANNGSFTDVLATVPVRDLKLKEDQTVAPAGIQVKTFLDNFATVNTYAAADEPVQLPDFLAYPLKGRLIGLPAQGVSGAFNFRAADKIVSVRSNGAGTTNVLRIEEYE